jgi:hypothetical protein
MLSVNIAMRPIFPIIMLLVVLITSCKKPGVPFQSGGELSLLEKQSLVALHPEFAGWVPDQSALWVRHGETRHVCVRAGGIGSISMPFDVVVFDEGGKVVEVNLIDAPNPLTENTAKFVTSISPVRVVFETPNGKLVELMGCYSSATWRQDTKKRMVFEQEMREILRSWDRSGSTNMEELRQLMQRAIDDFHK